MINVRFWVLVVVVSCLLTGGCCLLCPPVVDPFTLPPTTFVSGYGYAAPHWMLLQTEVTPVYESCTVLVCRDKTTQSWLKQENGHIMLGEVSLANIKWHALDAGFTNINLLMQKPGVRWIDVDNLRKRFPKVEMLIADDGKCGFMCNLSTNPLTTMGQFGGVVSKYFTVLSEASNVNELKVIQKINWQGPCRNGEGFWCELYGLKQSGTLENAVETNNVFLKNFSKTAPDKFRARFITTKGNFIVEVDRKLAPNGADRFYSLICANFFKDIAFFRVLPGFICQFGICGHPDVAAKWRDCNILDDEVVSSNVCGMVSFAQCGPNTRSTQLFINLCDNHGLDKQGFVPFGKVTSGMGIVEKLCSEYGDHSWLAIDHGPDQTRIQLEGNEYLRQNFPKLDYIESVVLEK